LRGVFGFSFGEIMVLLVVGIVVVGPRKLPAMMRTMGQWVAKLRRMSTDLRAQSGIDDLIRQEGIEREIRELRSLSRMNVIETLVTPVTGAAVGGSVVRATPRLPGKPQEPEAEEPPPEPPLREREYPLIGCDSYGAYSDDEDLYAGEMYEPAPDAEPQPKADEGAQGAEGAA
jgi:sec-independent protein translocase protein TatB